MIASVWILLAFLAPGFFVQVYLPDYLLGLALCSLQGHYEHARGTVSHYGWIYNLLFFNDGYHAEHHANPREHWTHLPRTQKAVAASRWPAVCRWMELFSLDSLERIVVRFPLLQGFVLRWHEAAFRKLLSDLPEIQRVGIVGGALFPRTALITQRLLPRAEITIIEASKESIRLATPFLSGAITTVHARYPSPLVQEADFDLLVIPLAFMGSRKEIYASPKTSAVLVHDWIWRPRGTSTRVSWILLKRLNLIRR
jgi:hypothetical protein